MADDKFLEAEEAPESTLIEIQANAATLSELYGRFVEAQRIMEDAKRAYDTFRCVTLPNLFRMNGVTQLQLTDGTIVKVQTVYHCSPNKNAGDKQALADWLRTNGGGNIVKEEGKVAAPDLEALKTSGIPHSIETAINTNSLKAWIKGAIGADGSPATIDMDDIPPYVHFIAMDECTIS